jgi:Flp pilus assembly protein TadD
MRAGQATKEYHVQASLCLSKLLTSSQQNAEGINVLETVLQAAPSECPLPLYLMLGSEYLKQDRYQYALDVYGQACACTPCAAAWMGAGVSCLRLGRLADAELALAEANVMDCHNARIWAYLALVHILVENYDDAAMVRHRACRR